MIKQKKINYKKGSKKNKWKLSKTTKPYDLDHANEITKKKPKLKKNED